MNRSPQGGVFRGGSGINRGDGQEAEEEKRKHTGGELGGARAQDGSPFSVEFPLYMTVLPRGVKFLVRKCSRFLKPGLHARENIL
jgi:hypothetical protein